MVSVVITTKNSIKFIGKCVRSLKGAYPFMEVIVVDNNSTDGTVKEAIFAGARVFNKGRERSTQRNYGIAQAEGEYILFLDVDMRVSPELVAECMFKIKKYDALYIPEVIEGKGFWIKVRNFERGFYTGTCVDAVRFFRKGVVKFDPKFTGVEDWDFDRRIKGKKGITDNVLYHNEGKFDLKKYLQKKAYYITWMGKYKKKYPQAKELNPFYRFAGVFVEKGKWKQVLAHPILMAGVLYLKIRIGLIYLSVKKS